MSFVSSVFLPALGFATIPLILYLLKRHRVIVIDWAAMDFLRDIIEKQQKKMRLEELLLLLLRTLLFLFLVLAIAQPFIKGIAEIIGLSGNTTLAVDGSFSMAAQQGAQTRLHKAQERAVQIIDNLDSDSGVALIKGSARPETVVGTFSTDHGLLTETIKSMKVSSFGSNPIKTIQAIKELAKSNRGAQQSIYILSDFQQRYWQDPSEVLKTEIKALTAEHTVYMVPVGDGNTENLSATGLLLPKGSVRAGQRATFLGRVTNHGVKTAQEASVSLILDGKIAETKTISVAPGQTAKVVLSCEVMEPGFHEAVLRLGEDRNFADNNYSFGFVAYEKMAVLAVEDQEPDTDTIGPSDFIEIALNPYRERSKDPRALYQVERIGMGDLTLKELDDYTMVVLTNIAGFTGGEVEALLAYMKGGGGVLLFLGDKVDASAYNINLYDDGRGMVPFKLLDEPIKSVDENAALAIKYLHNEHPIWGSIITEKKNYMEDVRFYSSFGFENKTDKNVTPLASAMKDGVQYPMILDIAKGRGHLVVVGSSADLSWNNFATRPSYVAFINQISAYLTRERLGTSVVEVGYEVEKTLNFENSQSTYLLETPEREKRTISVLKEEEKFILTIGQLDTQGFYRLTNKANPKDQLLYAVNLNSDEGEIISMNSEELIKRYQPLGVVVDGSTDLSEIIDTGGSSKASIATLLLFLMLLCWIGENYLAHRIAART